MLGWSIAIYREADYQRFDFPELSDLAIAAWTAGLGGLKWLDPLVKEGKATEGGNGYPLWVKAKADVLLPLVAQGPPPHEGPFVIGEDYVRPGGWLGDVKISAALLANCPADEDLIVIAWDQD